MEKNPRKFSLVKWFGCFFSALVTYARYGFWTMHLFDEDTQVVVPAIIKVKGNKFRFADSLDHSPNEKVYTNGAYIEYYCSCCGKRKTAWAANYTKYMMER